MSISRKHQNPHLGGSAACPAAVQSPPASLRSHARPRLKFQPPFPRRLRRKKGVKLPPRPIHHANVNRANTGSKTLSPGILNSVRARIATAKDNNEAIKARKAKAAANAAATNANAAPASAKKTRVRHQPSTGTPRNNNSATATTIPVPSAALAMISTTAARPS